jgi:DNA-binding transcriptional ArsR family regulator
MDVFTALAVPTRRNIIEILATEGRLAATDICDRFDVTPPAISQHLKVLRAAKLVQMEKDGQHRIYQLDMEGMHELELWAQKMTGLWTARFAALDKVLEAEKERLLKAKRRKK